LETLFFFDLRSFFFFLLSPSLYVNRIADLVHIGVPSLLPICSFALSHIHLSLLSPRNWGSCRRRQNLLGLLSLSLLLFSYFSDGLPSARLRLVSDRHLKVWNHPFFSFQGINPSSSRKRCLLPEVFLHNAFCGGGPLFWLTPIQFFLPNTGAAPF